MQLKNITKTKIRKKVVYLNKSAVGNGEHKLEGRLNTVWRNVRRDYALLIMMIVPIAFFIIFCYVPMYGIIISFQDFKLGSSFFGNVKWVGLRWYQEFFRSPLTRRVIVNTVMFNVLTLVFVFPLPILLSVVLNEVKRARLKGFIQTVSYLPYFLSTTVVVAIFAKFLTTEGGVVNKIIETMGMEKIPFMQKADWFRPLFLISEAWQSTGFNCIIFLAAIAGISPTLYEAAYMDGGTRLKNIWYITLPSIKPTIIIMLILRMGSSMTIGFEKILLMYGPTTFETADVISTYIYRMGISQYRLSYATAMGLFNSVVNISILLLTNTVCRKLTEISLW